MSNRSTTAKSPRPEPTTLTPDDLYWMEELENAQRTSLDHVRSDAEKWGATIGGLTGIFGIAALIKGREDISELADQPRTWVLILVALAVIAAGLATWKAAVATQGRLDDIYATGSAYRAKYEKLVKDASNNLATSKFLAALATVLLGVAISFLWLGEPAKKEGAGVTQYLIVRRDGAPLCGELQVAANGVISLKSDASASLGQVESMTAVDSCPGETGSSAVPTMLVSTP